MTADPAAVPTRPGRRAVEFARWAADEFGRTGPRPGTVVVDRTQKALTAACGRGAGTVAWYMSQLRTAGVVLSSRPLVLDLSALETPLPAPPTRPPAASVRPELVGLMARHAELVAQVAQLLAAASEMQAGIARVVANDDPAEVAELAVVRDIQKGRKVEITFLAFLIANPSRATMHDMTAPLGSAGRGI